MKRVLTSTIPVPYFSAHSGARISICITKTPSCLALHGTPNGQPPSSESMGDVLMDVFDNNQSLN
jgi:hypothetical protein